MVFNKLISCAIAGMYAVNFVACINTSADYEDDRKNSYMNAILSFLENGEYEYGSSFSLSDINGDGEPEMIICEGWSHYAGCRVYTFNNGRLVNLWRYGTYGDLGYDSEKNFICTSDLHQGYEFENFYRLSGGKMELIAKFSNNMGAAASDEELYYRFNDQDVSAEEYTEMLNQYSGNYENVGRDNSLDAKGILSGFAVEGLGNRIRTISKIFAAALHTLKF